MIDYLYLNSGISLRLYLFTMIVPSQVHRTWEADGHLCSVTSEEPLGITHSSIFHLC